MPPGSRLRNEESSPHPGTQEARFASAAGFNDIESLADSLERFSLNGFPRCPADAPRSKGCWPDVDETFSDGSHDHHR
jgi:hypothetical protein